MELVRLSAPLAALEDVVARAASGPVVFSCTDADTVICAASLRDRLAGPIGVWLEVGEDYPAQLCARDVATLSWLVALDRVVVATKSRADQHAAVVRALLTNDEVSLVNDVAVLEGAYNRPAPPAPLEVWSFDGALLVCGDVTLRPRASAASGRGSVTTFG